MWTGEYEAVVETMVATVTVHLRIAQTPDAVTPHTHTPITIITTTITQEVSKCSRTLTNNVQKCFCCT